MGTATTSATLLSLALAGWLGATAASPAAPVTRPPATAQAQTPPPPAPQGAPADTADGAGSGAARNAPPPAAGREKRRRTSYASCNRESHRRNLRGGTRRRFLIRCRLGYERRQQPAVGQGGAQGQAPPPARRP